MGAVLFPEIELLQGEKKETKKGFDIDLTT